MNITKALNHVLGAPSDVLPVMQLIGVYKQAHLITTKKYKHIHALTKCSYKINFLSLFVRPLQNLRDAVWKL